MVTGIRLPSFYYPGMNGLAGGPPRREAPVASDLLALQATSETGAQISITTDEGDTVTITLHSELDANYAFYRRSGDGTSIEATAFTASASRDVEISVQGDLNEQERTDISNLLKRLDHVIRSFVKGNFNAAVHQALEGPSLDSLSGYTLNVEHTDSLTLIRATGGAPQGSSDPGTQEFSPLPRAQIQSPLGGPRPEVKDVLDEMLKAAKESRIDLAKSGKVLVKLLRQLLHRMAHEPGMGPARPALDEIAARFPEHLRSADSDCAAPAAANTDAPEPARC
jgi:hypothetical protein